MKNFKLISILFNSLALFMMIGILFTACQKIDKMENTPTEESVEFPEYLNGKYIVLPVGYEEEADQIVYLQNASNKLIDKLVENYRIAQFLHQQNMYWTVYNEMVKDEHFADLDLALFLNEKQLVKLSEFKATESNIVERGSCYTVSHWWPCYTERCCVHPPTGNVACYFIGNFC